MTLTDIKILVTESMDGCAMAVLDNCKVFSEEGRPQSMIEVSSRNFIFHLKMWQSLISLPNSLIQRISYFASDN